jgi:hypothetical protein
MRNAILEKTFTAENVDKLRNEINDYLIDSGLFTINKMVVEIDGV